jgi:hypothetical protein
VVDPEPRRGLRLFLWGTAIVAVVLGVVAVAVAAALTLAYLFWPLYVIPLWVLGRNALGFVVELVVLVPWWVVVYRLRWLTTTRRCGGLGEAARKELPDDRAADSSWTPHMSHRCSPVALIFSSDRSPRFKPARP